MGVVEDKANVFTSSFVRRCNNIQLVPNLNHGEQCNTVLPCLIGCSQMRLVILTALLATLSLASTDILPNSELLEVRLDNETHSVGPAYTPTMETTDHAPTREPSSIEETTGDQDGETPLLRRLLLNQ